MSRAATILVLSLGWLMSGSARAAEPEGEVAADLQAIYAQTSSATAEADFTEIARACSKIIPDANRSEADKAYATRLFAWALNRRGEVRGETAARLVREGDLEKAQKLDELAGKDFATAAKYAPDNWRIHHNLAIAHAMQGRFDEAIDAFTQVIELKTDYPNAYYNRAELYFEKEQFAQAVTDYSQAIELSSSDASYYNGRAHARFMLNDTDAALADYTRAAKLDSTNAAYLTDLADALQSTGQWEAASARYREAVAADKTYARAYRNIAWLLSTCPDQRFRNPNLALTAARKAIELEGEQDYRALDTLAAATAATGDAAAAAKLMRQALAAAPASARAELSQRTAIYQQGGQFVQSVPQPTRKMPTLQQSEVRTASATEPINR
ncbi:MAG: tetratricopeptide repeat protein [Aureliella sp.]